MRFSALGPANSCPADMLPSVKQERDIGLAAFGVEMWLGRITSNDRRSALRGGVGRERQPRGVLLTA